VKDIAGIDPAKYSIGPDPKDPTKAVVYSVSEPRLALCYVIKNPDGSARLVPAVQAGNSLICTHDKVPVSPYRRSIQSTNGLIIRSTFQIIEYLGQVLNFQEKAKIANRNRCLTLAGERDQRTCDDNVLFQVNPSRGYPLVTTMHQGSSYTIGVGPCDVRGYCDHSAEVLKIVNLLINLNKSAANIPQVPIVRVVQ
jgi:hypothetical protein